MRLEKLVNCASVVKLVCIVAAPAIADPNEGRHYGDDQDEKTLFCAASAYLFYHSPYDYR